MFYFLRRPKVSIIIPVYNTSQWLMDCLVSVLKQTLKNIEVICINDGSTDNSLEIITNMAQADDRIVIINQDNKGLSDARNIGLEKAHGKYIYFLDSDDMLASDNILYELLNLSTKLNLDMIIGEAEVLYDNDELENKYANFKQMYKIKNTYANSMNGFELIKQMRQNKDYYEPVSLKFYNRNFIKQNNMKFIKKQLHEDVIFTYKSLILASKIAILNKPIYIRRIRNNSIMTSGFTHKNLYGLMVTFVEAIKFLQNRKFVVTNNTDVCFLPKKMITSIVNRFIKLKNDEKELFMNMLSCEEKFYFDTFIKQVVELKQQISSIKRNSS